MREGIAPIFALALIISSPVYAAQVPIKKDERLSVARKALLKAGWQPVQTYLKNAVRTGKSEEAATTFGCVS